MDESSGIFNSDMTIQCPNPNCRHMNQLQGNLTAQRVGGRLQVIFQAMTPDQLHAVRDSLQALLTQPDATIGTVAESVESASPGLATWIRTKSNDNQGVLNLVQILLWIVSILLTVAQLLTDRAAPPPNVTNNQTIINQTIQKLDNGEAVNDPPIPRRQPCFCGSDKLYKNCCGRPGKGTR
jgi:hypothetical protein